MHGEISFDTVVEADDVNHLEGVFRLEGETWRVFYFTHRYEGADWTGDPIIIGDAVWRSGVRGVNAVLPVSQPLNKTTAKQIISAVLGGVNWTEGPGPDSLQLK